jgi:hypothetical protein
MRPNRQVVGQIEAIGKALENALGQRIVCLAVYGSAAGEEFSPEISDINLILVLEEVHFVDLELVGRTLERVTPAELRLATPLVVDRRFLDRARDVFAIELRDIRDRHRLLSGQDLLSPLRIDEAALRSQAERELRGKVLRLRSLVIERPAETVLRSTLAHAATTFSVILRSLLPHDARVEGLGRGHRMYGEVARYLGVHLEALEALDQFRGGEQPWPEGAELRHLLHRIVAEAESLAAVIDAHGA